MESNRELKRTRKGPKGKVTFKKETKPQDSESSDDNIEKSNNFEMSDELDSDYESESESEEQDDDEDLEGAASSSKPEKKVKKKKGNRHDSNDFASVLGNLLSQTPGANTEQSAVLSKDKKAAAKIDSDKLEYKAKKAISFQKKSLAAKDRVLPDVTNLEYEKKLRKVATRGVVKLFNAIRLQQRTDIDELPLKRNEKEEVAKMSKASFLSLLKSGSTKPAQ